MKSIFSPFLFLCSVLAVPLLICTCNVLEAAPRFTLPSVAGDSIAFAQITENRPIDLSRAKGGVGFVWGGRAQSPDGIGSFYYPLDRDLDRAHTAEWYAAHFPERIVYKCDRKTPAAVFTYSWGSYTPLDIANPQVRAYILATFIEPALLSGQKIIALDNVGLINHAGRCGVWRDGTWQQLYSGEPRDPVYAVAVTHYLQWLAANIHERGGMLALNAKVIPNDLERTRALIGIGDIWLEEEGFTRGCRQRVAGTLWQEKFVLSQWAAARMGWIDLEKTCAAPDSLPDEEAEWVVGNFLLARGAHSYLSVMKEDAGAGVLRYPGTLNPPAGRALGQAFRISGGWARRYTHGMVIVNPSETAALHYDLPAGSWTDLRGQPRGPQLTLAPTTAAILLRQ